MKGFAEKVSVSHEDQNDKEAAEKKVWYILHHGVTNINKPGKLRVVFDCSAEYGGILLNEAEHQGPDLTNKLVGVLLRFREKRFGIMSDVKAK